MSLSTSRQAYNDCYEVLEAALKDPSGVRVRMESLDAATHMRMRIHKARNIDRKDNAAVYDVDHKMHGCSQYDGLVAKLRKRANGWYVYLEHVKLTAEVEKLSEIDEEAEDELIEAETPIEKAYTEARPLLVEPIKRRV